MFNVNRCTLLGRVSSDTVSYDAKNKRAVFILETKKAKENHQGEDVESHMILCHGPLSGFARDRVKKDAPLYLEGHLSTLKTGETVIIADRFVLLSK